jgi:hypothetical protein
MDEIAAGDSPEQRAAESVMLGALSAELQVRLAKKRMVHADGAWAELDGWSHDPPILVEVWAHQGIPKSAQKAKVMTDALKMLWVEATFYPAGARKILLLSDQAAAAHFGRMSWMAAALRHFAIEVRVVDLPDEHRAAVQKAQGRQFR